MAIQANTVGGPLDDIYKDLKLLPTEVLKSYLQNPNNMQADGVSFSLMAGGVLADRARQQAAFAASQQPNPAQIPTVAQTLAQGQPVGVEGVPAGGAGITAFSTQAQQPQQQQQPQQITLNQPKQATPISLATPYAAAKTPLQQQVSAPPTPTRKMAQGGIVALSGGGMPKQEPGESFEDFRRRVFEEDLARQQERNAERAEASEQERMRRLGLRQSNLGMARPFAPLVPEGPGPAISDAPYPETAGMRYPTSTSISTPTAVTNAAKTSTTKEGFIQEVLPLANEAAQRLNVPVQAVLGQWAAETGWGKSVIPGTYNLGNIKADPNWKGPSVMAVDNQTRQREPYRAYGSPEEAAADFTRLLETGRYKNVPGATTPKDYFSALKKAGYATDKDYEATSLGVTRDVEGVLSALGIQGGQGVQSGVASLLQGPPMTASANPAMARMVSPTTPTATAATPSTPTTPETAPGLPSLRETPEMKEAFANIGTMPSFSAADAEKARKEAAERLQGAIDPRMAEIQKLYAAQSGIAGKGQENFMPLMVAGLGAQLAQMSAPKGTLAHGLGAIAESGIGSYRKNQQEQVARELEANKLQIKLQEQLMKQGVDQVTAGNVAEKEARKIVEDTAEARSKMGGRQAQAISSSTTAQASLERAQNQLTIAQNQLIAARERNESLAKIRELELIVRQEQQRVRELAEARASIAERRKTLEAEAKTLEGDFRPEARARLTSIRAQLAASSADGGATGSRDIMFDSSGKMITTKKD